METQDLRLTMIGRINLAHVSLFQGENLSPADFDRLYDLPLDALMDCLLSIEMYQQ